MLFYLINDTGLEFRQVEVNSYVPSDSGWVESTVYTRLNGFDNQQTTLRVMKAVFSLSKKNTA